MPRIESSSGFSLIEVMVASAILGCAVLSVAQLVAAATGSTSGARGVSEATLLAWQKIDELHALALTFDDAGGPVTDVSLQPSAAGVLRRDTAGWVDYPATLGTRYRRRWAIDLSGGSPDLLILRVRVLGPGGDQELASAAAMRARRRP
jgi:prepilin-type N-terminal cleavage/methylation domain-containing protein